MRLSPFRSRHGPDGLSRRKPQPNDEIDTDDADDFEDWIDRLHGFLHQINPIHPRIPISSFPHSHSISSVSVFAGLQVTGTRQDFSWEEPSAEGEILGEEREVLQAGEDNEEDYGQIPRPAKATDAEERLLLVQEWLTTLERPTGLSDAAYEGFIKYALHFFIDSDRLWRRDSQGAHKLVIPPSRRIPVLRAAHDEVGHRGVYATRALVEVIIFSEPYLV